MNEQFEIFLSPPQLAGAEAAYLNKAVDSNWLAPVGPDLTQFEEELSRVLEDRTVAAVSSGTAALHLALILLGVSAEDEVLVSTFTFAASANPVVYQKAVPIFIDAEEETWNMDPNLLEDAVNDCLRRGRAPKAVVAVHLYGMPFQIDAVAEICARYEIPLIEDAAEALGSRWHGQPLGSFGAFAVLSFNGNKIITTSGGGALAGSDAASIARARHLAAQARDPAPWYQHSCTGYNYRLSNLLAALGRGQLEQLPAFVARRRANYDYYRQRLSGLPGIRFLDEPNEAFFSNRWLTTLLVDRDEAGVGWQELQEALAAAKIESRPLWKPLHLQPVFKGCPKAINGTSEQLFSQGLCLPSGTALDERALDRVCGVLETVLTRTVRTDSVAGRVEAWNQGERV